MSAKRRMYRMLFQDKNQSLYQQIQNMDYFYYSIDDFWTAVIVTYNAIPT